MMTAKKKMVDQNKSNTEHSESAYEKIIDSQTDKEFASALDALDQKVSEKVSSRLGEDIKSLSGATTKDDKKSGFDFSKFSKQIGGLLGARKTQKIVIPSSRKEQEKHVIHALEKEVKNLVKETHKIQNAKKFSPAKLENVLIQIRHLQKALSQVVHLAKEILEQWYRKYVRAKA